MLHWTPARTTELPVTPVGALVTPALRSSRPRADHARMMDHAATRRRAASGADADADYWKACAPAAVARAASLRAGAGFARLP